MKKLTNHTTIVAITLLLAGCSNAPSDAEVNNLTIARMNSMGEAELKVIEARNTGCTNKNSKEFYTCAVELEMEIAPGTIAEGIVEINILKKNGAWSYDENQVLSMKQKR